MYQGSLNTTLSFEMSASNILIQKRTHFIKLLCRLYDPAEGEILLNGLNIQKYDYDEYMSVFSVVFQDFSLLSFKLGEECDSPIISTLFV